MTGKARGKEEEEEEEEEEDVILNDAKASDKGNRSMITKQMAWFVRK